MTIRLMMSAWQAGPDRGGGRGLPRLIHVLGDELRGAAQGVIVSSGAGFVQSLFSETFGTDLSRPSAFRLSRGRADSASVWREVADAGGEALPSLWLPASPPAWWRLSRTERLRRSFRTCRRRATRTGRPNSYLTCTAHTIPRPATIRPEVFNGAVRALTDTALIAYFLIQDLRLTTSPSLT